MVQLTQTLATMLLASGAIAHPGAHISRDIIRRKAHLEHPERRSLTSCKRDLVESGWVREQALRRHKRFHELQVAAGFASGEYVAPRDVSQAEETWGESAQCTLDPEATEGPYWVQGELIRQDLLTGEKGVITHLDINVIDTSGCKPVTDAYVELWGCNSTGVYTGVQARGNGDGSASAVVTNALRGVQPTNSTGTASFISVIPGHYVGRANHLHTIIHHGAKLLPNNTITGGTISHVGQFYVEQKQLAEFEKTAPYNTNKQTQTLNSQDMLYRMGSQGGDDPNLHIKYIGTKPEDGIYAYIDVGVNPKAKQNPQPVNMWTEKGGVPAPGSPWTGYPDSCKYCGFGGGGTRPPTERSADEIVEEYTEVQ